MAAAALTRFGSAAAAAAQPRWHPLAARPCRPHATAPPRPSSCLAPGHARRRCGSGDGSTDPGSSQPSSGEQQASQAPPPPSGGEEQEDQSWTPEVATLFLNFCIVFVLAFFIPSLLPGDVSKTLGLGTISIGAAAVAAAVAFLTRPQQQQ
jgi:hypothetical protein